MACLKACPDQTRSSQIVPLPVPASSPQRWSVGGAASGAELNNRNERKAGSEQRRTRRLLANGGCRAGCAPGRHSISLSRVARPFRGGALGLRPGGPLAGYRARLWKRVCGHRADGGPVSRVRVSAGRNFPPVGGAHAGVHRDGVGDQQPVFGAHVRSGLPASAPLLWRSRREVGGMALGVFALWNLLWRRLGLVYVSADVAALFAFSHGAEAGELWEPSPLDWLRPAHWLSRAHRAGCPFGVAVPGSMDLLPALPARSHLDDARHRRDSGSVCGSLPLDRSQLRDFPSVHSRTQRFGARAVYRQQRLFHALGEQDRKSTRLNSSHANISYDVFC